MTNPPKYTEAEKAVLGNVLYFPETFHTTANSLTEKDFYHEAHRILWRTLTELTKEEVPIDLATISKRLYDKGVFETLGGSGFLFELMEQSEHSSDASFYVQKVKEFAVRRALASKTSLALDNLQKSNVPLRKITTDLAAACFKTVDPDFRENIISQADSFRKIFQEISDPEYTPSPIKTGFYGLDSIFHGFAPGNLYVVAARPGMGKTAFLLDVAEYVARARPVYLFSLEMPERQIQARLISKYSKISTQRIINGDLTDEEKGKIVDSAESLLTPTLFIDSSATLRPVELYTRVKLHSARNNVEPALIVVDYLQYMTPDETQGNREREVASISRALKVYAMKLSVPILFASQLNRQIESRPPKERMPRLSDLRESGSIEQDVAVAVGLIRPAYYEKNHGIDSPNTSQAFINVMKNRNGPLGVVELVWDATTASFKNS